jgi:hypothetical protein
METYGRERRHRYFTLAAYRRVMASEGLHDTTTSIIDVDLSRVGKFAALDDPKHFYTTTGKLHSYQDSFKDIATTKGRKRKRDEEGRNGEESEPLPKPKRGRPRKTPALTVASTIPPKKRGRPRKKPLAKDGEAQSAASGGSPSKPMTEVYAEGEEQADHHSIAQRKEDDAIVSGDPQSLEREGPQGKSSVSVAQEGEPTVVSPVSTLCVLAWMLTAIKPEL